MNLFTLITLFLMGSSTCLASSFPASVDPAHERALKRALEVGFEGRKTIEEQATKFIAIVEDRIAETEAQLRNQNRRNPEKISLALKRARKTLDQLQNEINRIPALSKSDWNEFSNRIIRLAARSTQLLESVHSQFATPN